MKYEVDEFLHFIVVDATIPEEGRCDAVVLFHKLTSPQHKISHPLLVFQHGGPDILDNVG